MAYFPEQTSHTSDLPRTAWRFLLPSRSDKPHAQRRLGLELDSQRQLKLVLAEVWILPTTIGDMEVSNPNQKLGA